MTMQTHIVPVGFDYDRLIRRWSATSSTSTGWCYWRVPSAARPTSSTPGIAEKLEQDYRDLLGADTERFVVEDVYDYDAAFEQAFGLIGAQLDNGEGGVVHLQPEREVPVGSRGDRAAASGVRRRRACPSVLVRRRRVTSPAGVR